jgi:hypothetical protein
MESMASILANFCMAEEFRGLVGLAYWLSAKRGEEYLLLIPFPLFSYFLLSLGHGITAYVW